VDRAHGLSKIEKYINCHLVSGATAAAELYSHRLHPRIMHLIEVIIIVIIVWYATRTTIEESI